MTRERDLADARAELARLKEQALMEATSRVACEAEIARLKGGPGDALRAEAARLRVVLAMAYAAMNYMGDKLNEGDSVEDEDMAATTEAFEAVATALGEEVSRG